MPLDKNEVTHIRRMLKEALKKERYFAYLQEGADGEPLLYVEKKESVARKKGREAKRGARMKILVTGRILATGPRTLAFVTSDPKKGKLPRNLKQVFGSQLPPLKRVQCLSDDDYAALQEQDPGVQAEALHRSSPADSSQDKISVKAEDLKRAQRLQKGAEAIQRRLKSHARTKAQLLQRFQAIDATGNSASEERQAIIEEMRAYIEDLKRLKTRYERIAA